MARGTAVSTLNDISPCYRSKRRRHLRKISTLSNALCAYITRFSLFDSKDVKMRKANLYKVDWWIRRPSKGCTRNRGDVGLFGGYCNQIHVHPAIASCMLEHLLFQSTRNMPSSPLWGEICLWEWIANNQKIFLNVNVNIIWCLWTETGEVAFIFFRVLRL